MTPEALNLYHHRKLELSGSSLGRDKGLEAMRILLQVLHQGDLGRTDLLHDVGECLQKFGAAIHQHLQAQRGHLGDFIHLVKPSLHISEKLGPVAFGQKSNFLFRKQTKWKGSL